MSKISTHHKRSKNTTGRITYYFTGIFIVIGTILVFSLLLQKAEKLNLFILFLALAGGGLPLGIVGVCIDYKISQLKSKAKSVKRLKEEL